MTRSFVNDLMKPKYVVPVAAWVGCALLAQQAISGMDGFMRVGPTSAAVVAAATPKAGDGVELSQAAALEQDRAPAMDQEDPEFAESARDVDRM